MDIKIEIRNTIIGYYIKMGVLLDMIRMLLIW